MDQEPEIPERVKCPGFYSCLGAYNQKFGDKLIEYFLAARSSTSPSKIPIPRRGEAVLEIDAYAIKMLRELFRVQH